MKVKTKVATIGNSVKTKNPMTHGAMKRYPQRARRHESPENRARVGRATLEAVTT